MSRHAAHFDVKPGAPLECPICSGAEFVEGKAQLNTSVMTFLNFDWANRSAYYYSCVGCGQS